MNTIYNIYENYYQSILGSTLSKVKTTAGDVDKTMSTYKEKFLKIIALASEMNDSQESAFRSFVDETITTSGGKYIHCQFPKDLTNHLIVSSKSTLNKKDFQGFPCDKREYEFQSGLWFSHLNTVNTNLTSTKYLYGLPNNTPQNFVDDYCAIRFGKAAIVRSGGMLYIWINKIHRVVVWFDNNGGRAGRDLYHSTDL
jgi:hypothetical protein